MEGLGFLTLLYSKQNVEFLYVLRTSEGAGSSSLISPRVSTGIPLLGSGAPVRSPRVLTGIPLIGSGAPVF